MNAFETIQRTAIGFQSASVLIAAAEHNLFTAILSFDRAPTAEQLAAETKLDLRALTVELDALASLGFLSKRLGRYRVPAKFRAALDSRSPTTLVPMLCHWGCCQRSWSRLGAVLRTGAPEPRLAGPNGPEADRRAFFLGMNSLGVRLAPTAAADLIKAFPRRFGKALDLGGATGTYTLAFLRAGVAERAVLFDVPAAVAEAKKRLALDENRPFRPRVRLVAGDFYRDALPKGCDLHWISAIIHQQDAEATAAMFQKSFRALRRGGVLAVRDIFVDPARTASTSGALFAVNMLANTHAGRVYTLAETFELMTDAGFKRPRLLRPDGEMSAVVVAEKP